VCLDGMTSGVLLWLVDVRAGRMTVLLALTLAKRVVRRRMEGMMSFGLAMLVDSYMYYMRYDQKNEAELSNRMLPEQHQ